MHHNNPFKGKYDLKKLSKVCPDLKRWVILNKKGEESIDFGHPNAVKTLNGALLKWKYDLNWSLPEPFLCPPIPGRMDYLMVLNDIFPLKDQKLLDIGTGANMIYPLLAQKAFNCEVIASDISMEALACAEELVQKNDLEGRIQLRHQKQINHFFKGVIHEEERIDVVICNPPFFKSEKEALMQNNRKVRGLNKSKGEPTALKKEQNYNFGGQANELWCKGGALQFVKGMIQESILFKEQVQLFTVLIFNEDHLRPLKKIAQQSGAKTQVLSMSQGQKKSRVLTWKF